MSFALCLRNGSIILKPDTSYVCSKAGFSWSYLFYSHWLIGGELNFQLITIMCYRGFIYIFLGSRESYYTTMF